MVIMQGSLVHDKEIIKCCCGGGRHGDATIALREGAVMLHSDIANTFIDKLNSQCRKNNA